MKNNKQISNEFINIRLLRYPSLYHVRKTIYDFIKNNSIKFSGKVLDLGCGQKPYRETILGFSSVESYVGLDIKSAIVYDKNIKPDYYWDGKKIPFGDCTFDTIIATEVLEHCQNPEVVISEIFRVLKKGGFFLFTVPFLFPLHETPHDEFRYTPFSLERFLKNSNFRNINIVARGGWRASLGQTLGLFLFYSKPTSLSEKILRKLIKHFVILLMLFLYKTDIVPVDFTKEDVLITGLAGVANK